MYIRSDFMLDREMFGYTNPDQYSHKWTEGMSPTPSYSGKAIYSLNTQESKQVI